MWPRPGSGRPGGKAAGPAVIAVLAASALQMALPGWLSLGPHWLLPALELGLLVPAAAGDFKPLAGSSAARPPCGPVAWHWPGC